MLAITFETARTVAMIAVGVFLIGAVVAGILMKTIAQKLALVAILGLLAALVWTQRTALEDCAQLVRENVTDADTTCTFFGQDITIATGSGTDE
jgi:hypothetical protein